MFFSLSLQIIRLFFVISLYHYSLSSYYSNLSLSSYLTNLIHTKKAPEIALEGLPAKKTAATYFLRRNHRLLPSSGTDCQRAIF